LSKEQIAGAIAKRGVFPCLFGSALRNEGVKELLEFLYEYIDMPDYGKDFGARVFKIARDEQGNRLTYMKVTGGCLKVRETLSSHPENAVLWEEKVNQIRVYSGARFETVNEAYPGCVCAVTGLTQTLPGEGIGSESGGELPVLEPVLVYKIALPDGVDHEEACIQKLYCEDIMNRLDEIMPMAREIGMLRMQGKSDREIARSLGIDRMTMLRMLERAKAVLRQEFEEN
jgi:translation elongation factor EF-G